MSAAGGTGAFTWSVSVGSLPAGLAIDPATGIISGTPTTPQDSSFTVQVADGALPVPDLAALALSIHVAPCAFSIPTLSLPAAIRGATYTATLTGCGGKAPYKFTKVGSLPKGLKLLPTGAITGTPKKKATTTTFGVKLTDRARPKHTVTKTFTITVN